ncbi:MAG: hypothetical protein HQL95_01860 [Magnetococcales bacterium]|nr:hypothetical protein [Magnetococcales bacterium]
MSGPWCGNEPNAMYGFSQQYDTSFKLIHNENTSLLADQLMLSGGGQNYEVYTLRPGTGLAAWLLFPYLSPIEASKLLNRINVILTTVVSFFLMIRCRLPLPRAILATLLILSLSIFNYHLNDMSGHLTAATFWALALLLILHYRPWAREQPLAITLWIACFLFYAISVYSFNIALYLALMVVMVREWRKLLVLCATLALFLVYWRLAWPWLINHAYGTAIPYGFLEGKYTAQAVHAWMNTFSAGNFLHHLQNNTVQFLFAEPVAAIIFAIMLLFFIVGWQRHGRHLIPVSHTHELAFLLLSALASLSLGVFFGPSASARGYLTYGFHISTIVLFATLSLPRLTQQRHEFMLLGLLAGLIVWQQAWIHGASTVSDPTAVCQYMTGHRSPTEVLTRFASQTTEPMTFIGLEEHASRTITSFGEMAQVMTAHFSATAPFLKKIPLASYYLIKSGIVRSFVFILFLLAPLLAMLIWTLMGRKQYSFLRSGMVVLGGFTVLWGCWLGLSVQGKINKNDELLVHRLKAECQQETLLVSHLLPMDRQTLKRLEAEQITGLYLLSNTVQSSEGQAQVTLRRLADSTESAIAIHEDNPAHQGIRIPLSRLQPASSGPSETELFVIEEHHQLPIRSFLAWDVPKPGTHGLCGTRLEPLIELRAFRPGETVPKFILFKNRSPGIPQ